MIAKNVIEEIESLPVEAQKEVVDFISFLRTRYVRKHNRKTTKTESGFIGMWKNRDDLKDSVAVVRSLRDSEWTRVR